MSEKVSDIWMQDGYDYILHLGTMRKAVVVAHYANSFKPYAISPRSYFPFTDEQRSKLFDNANDATEYAIEILKEWFNSIGNSPQNDKQVENSLKQIG